MHRDMTESVSAESAESVSSELIWLLHQGAPAEAFAQRAAAVEALPEFPGKSSLIERVRMAMAVRNRLELQNERERGMLAVIESAQDLSSRLNLQELLSTIVSRARNLLGADLAWLTVYDPEREGFHVLVADGAMVQMTEGMVARHRGAVSLVMTTRQPFMTPDYLQDRRFEHDPRLDEIFRNEGVTALVGVPLIWNGEVTGLLFVADRYHRMHTAHNVSILCTLASHGAVALNNARNFERANLALEKADGARAELERHVRSIQAAADAHEQMTSLLARGATLATLCESVAQLLGGSVLVLDEAAQVLSRGTADGYAGLGAQDYAAFGPHSAEYAQALRLSRQQGRSVSAYEVDGECCRVMPVIGGSDMLGSIALFHRRTLEEIEVRTFERSSSVIGIVLLSQERVEASKSRSVSTLVHALVSPRREEPALLANGAERHGLDLTRPLALLLLAPEGLTAGYAARRLRSLAAMEGTLVDEVDGNVVVVCSATAATEVRQTVLECVRRELGAACRGVLSRPLSNAAEIPALHASLKRALGVMARLGVQGRIVAQNELVLYSTLFESQDQASLTPFFEATIGPLIEHDKRRSTELTPTLLSYFDCNQNARTTAQRLSIHVNTVRQRLATIEGLIGAWGQASRALEVQMALRLWSLRG
jgi:sugar diacid utilization regulator